MARRSLLAGRFLLVGILLATCTLAFWQYDTGGRAQQSRRYFYETQHWIASPFFEYFESHGGVEIFGYPITEQYLDAQLGRRVQYFQRARMEETEEAGSGIVLSALAEEMGYARPRLAASEVPADSPYQRYFPQTGHSTSYAFLSFFTRRGGEEIFGLPITQPVLENGRLVQYFQRARMEWWPERMPEQRVALSPLGLWYADKRVDKARLSPALNDMSPPGGPTATPVVTRLGVLATVKEPITRPSGAQTVYVMATDQNGKALSGVDVTITVKSSVSTHSYPGMLTSEKGIAAVTFPLEPDPPGNTIMVDVSAALGGDLHAATQTSYLMWWGEH